MANCKMEGLCKYWDAYADQCCLAKSLEDRCEIKCVHLSKDQIVAHELKKIKEKLNNPPTPYPRPYNPNAYENPGEITYYTTACPIYYSTSRNN